MATFKYELCDTVFLDLNRTWYTHEPEFSPCFRDTALVWIPACMFLLTATSELSNIKEAKSRGLHSIPWNTFNIIRLFLTMLLFTLKTVQLIGVLYDTFKIGSTTDLFYHSSNWPSKIYNQNDREKTRSIILSSLTAPIFQSTSYLILGLIYHGHKKAGIHTSASVFFYLGISIICELIEFYSVIFIVVHQVAAINFLDIIIKLIHYPTLLILFTFECHGDEATQAETTNQLTDLSDLHPDSPELKASYFSSITFWWYNSFLMFGYKSRLKLTNLWKTLPRDKASKVVPLFRETWIRTANQSLTNKRVKETYLVASGESRPVNSMIWVLAKLFWRRVLYAAGLKFIQDSLQFATPIILKLLLTFMSSESAPNWHGVTFASLLLIVPTLQSVVLSNYFYHMQLIGYQVKTMIVGSIYRKSLLLSGSSRIQSTSGEIVNLMSVDSQRFQDLLLYVNLFWSAPYQIALAIYLLYGELGWSIFAGVVFMILVIPCNAYLANRVKFSQIKVMKTKDGRIKHLNEMLSGIRVIKLYAWEKSFMKNLFGFRDKELAYLKHILSLEALQTFLWQCIPFAVALITFAVYVSVDSANILDAKKAFVSISLFNLLRFPLTMLPSLVTSLVLTMVSTKRLNRFLNSNELIKYVTRNEELEAISIEGGTLSWTWDDKPVVTVGSSNPSTATPDSKAAPSASQAASGIEDSIKEQQSISKQQQKQQTKPVLRDIDLHIKRASFVAIVGQVASGKSSLLAAILGDMHRISGRFNVGKALSLAYVPQQAWIQNMSLRDNILFGAQYNRERYQQVLAACSLHADLEQLPGADQAEIGEKGINLSGGQKQRVSLARACYSNSDIYLLDDPLSALDSHVAKHVFEHVLSSQTGLLKNKTRVLATNSLFVLPHVDQVVVLDQGQLVESGAYEELLHKTDHNNKAGYLAEIMRQYSVNQAADQQAPPAQLATTISLISAPSDAQGAHRSASSLSKSPKAQAEMGKLIDIERVELGSVSYRVYLSYFKAVSWVWLASVVIAMVASTAFGVATNLWLAVWSRDAKELPKQQDYSLRTLRLVVYATFGGLQCLAIFVGSLALASGAVRASKRLHSRLLEAVIHSPMIFFDTTPIGRIVNRFAKDIDVVDANLPGTFRSWFNCFLQVISTLLVICYSFPSFIIIIIPLIIFYWFIQKIFIVTTRQLKRLESTTRSPIYSNFNETLAGISTIRAYNCVDRFVRYSDNLVDRNLSCSYPNIIANRWLSLRLELFGNIITSAAALFSVYYRHHIEPDVAGLTISYSLSITQTLSWFVRMTSDLETHIVSAERILEYIGNEQEDCWIKIGSRPPSDWPIEGSIQMDNFSARYRADTELVLRKLSLLIRPKEKIGIVGRTGSGKSSLSLALFRILEAAEGRILIDGLDVGQFGLHDIRSRLTIIPQDSVLFSGTLRFNLDPLELYSDADIWRAIQLAHLSGHLGQLNGGLDFKVIEFGENFSLGQRQLICLARAILRKSKILILDEATASVDLETDSIVQRTIRETFSECTIITIAHRLHTILDSDRILVLESGQVRELDTPLRLLEEPESAFSALVRDAGLDTGPILRQRRAERPN